MKLIKNFKKSLMIYQEQSAYKVKANWEDTFGEGTSCKDLANNKLRDLFIFEDGDLEKYPELKGLLDGIFEESELLRDINAFKTKYGFFRKKNTTAELLAQKDIEQRFPFKLLLNVFSLISTLKRWSIYEEFVQEYLNKLSNVPEDEFVEALTNFSEEEEN